MKWTLSRKIIPKKGVIENDKKKTDKYVLLYTIICILTFSIIYIPLLIKGLMYMYIDIGADTFCNYWPSLSYVSSLINDFKLWDTSLGLGASTMIHVSFFLADPFSWIILPFSDYNKDIGIFLSLIIKNGSLAFFSYRYFYKMHLNGWSRITASICVVFSGFFIGWGQHYHFASMFCVFIALLYFFEKWLQDRHWLGFTFTLSLHAAMMPYFCYMSLIFLGIYYLIRRVSSYWINWKDFITHILKTMALCLLGIGISAIVFLPTISGILNSPRVNGNIGIGFLPGTAQEYFSLLLRSLSNNILGINDFLGYANWYESPFVYAGIILFFMFPFFIKRHYSNKQTKITCFLLLIAIIFLHSTALIFNAFSTISYRWTYIFLPLMGLVIGTGISEIENSSTKKRRKYAIYTYIGVILVLSLYMVRMFSDNQRTRNYEKTIFKAIIIVFIVATLYFILLNIRWRKTTYLVIAITMVCVLDLAANGMQSVWDRSLIPRESKSTMAYFDETKSLINKINEQDTSFYRINKRYSQIDLNDSLMQDYMGEKYYTSVLNDSYWNLQEMFNLKIKNSNYFYGFDDIQSLRNINAGKYMISTEKREYYGYTFIEQEGDKYLYQNENNIGFGFLYSKYMLRSEFEKLNELEKQNVIYDTCIIDDKDAPLLNDMQKNTSFNNIALESINYQISPVEGGTEIILSDTYSEPLVLKISNQSNVPTDITGYTAQKDNEYSQSDVFNITIEAGTEKYYNLDVLDLNKILLNSPSAISVSLYKMDMTKIQTLIEEKRSNSMQLYQWDDEYYKGNIKSSSKSLLYLPIIYDKNWQIYVNGKKTPLLKINGGFCGVIIEKGQNDIQISYISNDFVIGKIISICSLIIIGGIYLYSIRKKNNQNKSGRYVV